MGRQAGPGLPACVLQCGVFPDIELTALGDGLDRVVNLLHAVQAGDRDHGVAVQDVADGQSAPFVVLFRVTLEQRGGGKGLDPEGPDVTLLERIEETVLRRSLRHCGKGKAHHFNLREVLNHELDPAAVVRGEADETGLALLLGLLQGVHDLARGVERVPPAGLQARDAPQVRVFLAGVSQKLVERGQQLLGRAVILVADLFGAVRERQIHLVASPLECPGVALDLAVPAGVDIVDARIDAAADDLGALLLVAARVPAQADGGNHQAGLSLSAVFHVRVVVEDFGGIDGFLGGLGGSVRHGRRTDSHAGGRQRRVPHELSSGHCFLFHRGIPLLLR